MNEPTTNFTRIVTLTMNPALDISTETRTVGHTSKVRCGPGRYHPGGGGVNVARVATALQASASAVLPVGGLTGRRILELLDDEGVDTVHVDIADTTRENVTVDELATGLQYRFVLAGPHMSADERHACLGALRRATVGAEFVVASGSLPPGVPPDFYQTVADACRDQGSLFVLDTSGVGLANLTSGAYLVKASSRELSDWAGRPLAGEDEQLDAAAQLISKGCTQSILVSRGADPALLVTPTGHQRFPAHEMPTGSGVGAGDAMVAGVVVGLSRCWSMTEAVRFGMACGAAMMLTPGTGICRPDDVWRLFDQRPYASHPNPFSPSTTPEGATR
ncbi:1-phosphofructokinase family hexose kinase [Mycolicibacterium lacusdiani]|uniref:1-phosphofructokinase family hexose kinase n=1 Tax=Mycolicibacterium lacusdiani TaxID=2895283 RepID=UPI001F36D716|nr:1-phosphofructokinase family hexose kinase [Mycolicibacterium lacusdiani]